MLQKSLYMFQSIKFIYYEKVITKLYIDHECSSLIGRTHDKGEKSKS